MGPDAAARLRAATVEIQELLAVGETIARRHGTSVGCIPKLSAPSVLNMLIEEADAVVNTTRQGVVLDWGCGFGQLAWLLCQRGLSVIAADLVPDERRSPSEFLIDQDIPFVPISSPVKLLWDNDFFDAVVSGGVLEHVQDLDGSLDETCRILRPGGCLYVFRFPQRYSLSEFLAQLRGQSVHPIRMTVLELDSILRDHGFVPFHTAHERFVPHLTGLANTAAYRWRQRLDDVCRVADRVGTKVPLVRDIAGSFRIFARKPLRN